MKRLLLVFGLMAVWFNLLAIDFMGVKLSGNVEEVADNFAEKGFTRRMGVIQEGPDKGTPAVWKTEEMLMLDGKFEGEKASLMLQTENCDELVTAIDLTIKNSSFNELYTIWRRVANTLIKMYGSPDVNYNSLIDQRSSGDSDTIFLKYWEKEDAKVYLNFLKDNSIYLAIVTNSSPDF